VVELDCAATAVVARPTRWTVIDDQVPRHILHVSACSSLTMDWQYSVEQFASNTVRYDIQYIKTATENTLIYGMNIQMR